MDSAKFVYVPNGIDIGELKYASGPLPEQHAAILEGLRSRRRFIIGYAGAHGLANALPSLIRAGQLLHDDDVSVVLVGQGPEKDRLRALVKELRIDNVVFLPPVAKDSIPTLLASMDVLYIGLQNKSVFRFGISPNKLLDYMMAAKPIIQSIKAGNDMVSEAGCGISVPPEDPGAVARAVRNLMALDEGERKAMGIRGRTFVIENHDYQVLASRFIECLA